MSAPGRPGTLVLVPNTLDLGTEQAALQELLPLGVIQRAAVLTHWAAEDARSARAFLKRVGLVQPLAVPLQAMDINELPRPRKGSQEAVPQAAWQALLQPALAGHDLGLISEAGLPGVADPGADLVLAAHAHGVTVVPLVGPSSLILAVAVSGLNGQSFAFVGYLPTDAAQRSQRIKALELTSRKQRQTQLVIETPYRNQALAQSLLENLAPDTWLSVACGLTLETGWNRTLRVSQWQQRGLSLPDNIPAVFAWLAP